jgi:hypothetical protein
LELDLEFNDNLPSGLGTCHVQYWLSYYLRDSQGNIVTVDTVRNTEHGTVYESFISSTSQKLGIITESTEITPDHIFGDIVLNDQTVETYKFKKARCSSLFHSDLFEIQNHLASDEFDILEVRDGIVYLVIIKVKPFIFGSSLEAMKRTISYRNDIGLKALWHIANQRVVYAICS